MGAPTYLSGDKAETTAFIDKFDVIDDTALYPPLPSSNIKTDSNNADTNPRSSSLTATVCHLTANPRASSLPSI